MKKVGVFRGMGGPFPTRHSIPQIKQWELFCSDYSIPRNKQIFHTVWNICFDMLFVNNMFSLKLFQNYNLWRAFDCEMFFVWWEKSSIYISIIKDIHWPTKTDRDLLGYAKSQIDLMPLSYEWIWKNGRDGSLQLSQCKPWLGDSWTSFLEHLWC